MIPVTAADIRRWSKVDFDELVGPIEDDLDPLQEEVDRAAALVQLTVGWFYDVSTLPPSPLFTTNPGLWIIPAFHEPFLRQAIQMATEWETFRHDPDFIEGLIDFDTVQSFTTRGYSEVRTTAGRGAVGMMALAKTLLHPWPALNSLMARFANPLLTQGDVPKVRAPGMPGAPRIRWDTGRYIIDAGRPGADLNTPYISVFDERPGGKWFVPGFMEAFWPS